MICARTAIEKPTNESIAEMKFLFGVAHRNYQSRKACMSLRLIDV